MALPRRNTAHRTGQWCVKNRFMRSSPFSFCQSIQRVFLQAAEISAFSKVRVCEAQHSNESPSGAFKRQNGLAQQDGGASPRQAHVDTARLLWLLSQQFNITYLLRVPARLPKESERVLTFLSLHSKPELRPSRKRWSGTGCCVAIFSFVTFLLIFKKAVVFWPFSSATN